ncbi:hypothetical protein PSTT_02882, partial [Puccinia striiformis]
DQHPPAQPTKESSLLARLSNSPGFGADFLDIKIVAALAENTGLKNLKRLQAYLKAELYLVAIKNQIYAALFYTHLLVKSTACKVQQDDGGDNNGDSLPSD